MPSPHLSSQAWRTSSALQSCSWPRSACRAKKKVSVSKGPHGSSASAPQKGASTEINPPASVAHHWASHQSQAHQQTAQAPLHGAAQVMWRAWRGDLSWMIPFRMECIGRLDCTASSEAWIQCVYAPYFTLESKEKRRALNQCMEKVGRSTFSWAKKSARGSGLGKVTSVVLPCFTLALSGGGLSWTSSHTYFASTACSTARRMSLSVVCAVHSSLGQGMQAHNSKHI